MANFEWDIWWKKMGKGLAFVLTSTGLLYLGEFVINNPLPEEYAFWGGLFTVSCFQIANWIKHNFL